ncbi:MAG: PAS domain S-box protein [Halofilum sp. (in: g-proteobacteria)]|nr:PAS domain S-box protein [Halofilum sp. (in: g-proteobacteria)]
MDDDGRYVYVNDAYCETYGHAREDLLGNVFTMVVAPEHEKTALDNHRATLATSQPLTRELEVRRADGSRMVIDTTSRRIHLPDGRRMRVATVLDITGIRANEQRLAEAESRLRGFTDALPGAVYQFRHGPDGDYRFTYMSRGLHTIGRFPPDYPLDDFATFLELVPEEDRPKLLEAVRASEKSLQPLHHRFRLTTPAGVLWLDARSTPTVDHDGTVVCNGFFDDVTANEITQRALSDERNLLGEIVENSVSALLIVDTDGLIVHANPRARSLLRLESTDDLTLADCAARIESADGTQSTADHQLLRHVIETGEPSENLRLIFRWGDKTNQTLSVNASPVHGAGGEIERIVLSLADVSRGVEAHMRAILEHTPALVYLKDLDGRFLYVNPEFGRHYGVTDEALRGQTVRDLFPPAVADEFEERDRHTLEQRGLTRFDISVPAPDGVSEERVFEALKFPILDDRGEIIALAGVEIDVTEGKQATRKLAEERNLLEEIVGTSLSGLVITDLDGRIVHANPSARSILRVADGRDQTLDSLALRLAEPDDSELATDHLPIPRVLAADGPVEEMRFALHHDDGTRQIIAVNASPVRDDNGDIERIVFSIMDLTSELDARNQLEQQISLFNAIIRDSSETLIVTDTERRIQMVNPAFTNLLGYSAEEVLGEPTSTIYADSEDHRRVGESYHERMASGEFGTRTHLIQLRDKEGRDFYAESVTDLLYDADGHHLGYVGLLRDVTERKAAEAELERQRALYANLVESTSAILWEADPETFAYTFVSGESEKLLGYTPEDWTSDPEFWPKHMHPEDREWAPGFCADTTARLEGHTFDYRMIARDGRTVWLRDIVSVVVENDQPNKLVGVMIDITETKQAEQELARSEARYRTLYHRTPVMLHSIDREGLLIAVSGYWLENLGYTEDQVLGRPSSDFLTEESARHAREQVLPEFFRTGRCQNVSYQVVRADGTHHRRVALGGCRVRQRGRNRALAGRHDGRHGTAPRGGAVPRPVQQRQRRHLPDLPRGPAAARESGAGRTARFRDRAGTRSTATTDLGEQWYVDTRRSQGDRRAPASAMASPSTSSARFAGSPPASTSGSARIHVLSTTTTVTCGTSRARWSTSARACARTVNWRAARPASGRCTRTPR